MAEKCSITDCDARAFTTYANQPVCLSCAGNLAEFESDAAPPLGSADAIIELAMTAIGLEHPRLVEKIARAYCCPDLELMFSDYEYQVLEQALIQAAYELGVSEAIA